MKVHLYTKLRLSYGSTLIIFFVALGLYCSNSSGGDEGECSAPIADGTIQELSGNCRAAGEEEHLRIEGASVPNGQISLWAKAADTSGDNGIRIVIDATNITYTNLSDDLENNTFEVPLLGAPAEGILCFDLHYEETPIHVLAWQGGECNRFKEGDGNEGATIFNSEDSGDPAEDKSGDEIRDQNRYLYEIEGGASASLIRTNEALFEE